MPAHSKPVQPITPTTPKTTKKRVMCGIKGCKNWFSDHRTLNIHLRKAHEPLTFADKDQGPVTGPVKLIPATECNWKKCTLKFHHKENFDVHFREDHLVPLNIPERVEYVEPNDEKHTQRKNYKCPFCKKPYAKQGCYVNHLVDIHWTPDQKANHLWPSVIWQ